MFSGIIEETGQIKNLSRRGSPLAITVKASTVLEDLKIGDSVNIDGACQTVVRVNKNEFAVEAVEETLKKTTFGNLKIGQLVNLERAVKASDRLGGHILTGHIDCKGKIDSIKDKNGSHIFEISLPQSNLKYLIEKGSIAVDGISLTIVEVKPKSLTVSVIPHTIKNTNFVFKKIGDEVNIELDIIGKYIEKMVHSKSPKSKITEEWLRKLGW
ncbi:MAG: riboflavin synthase [candidate division Zixibacteria bacterium]|nr:riboflavin synthase [candidate division Zixibacteria bacterium]